MRLEDICTIFTDGDWIESKDQSESGIRLVQTGNIGEGTYLEKETRAKYISEDVFERLKCTEIFPGDILISRLPDPVGRACIIPEKTERMITAVDCTICRTDESVVSKEYLCYFMRSNAYYTRLHRNVTGTTRKRISRKNLGNVELSVPTKDEQKAVVKRLDCLVKVIDLRTKELKLLDDLTKARFIEIFGDPIQNPKGWALPLIEDVVANEKNALKAGPFGSALKKEYYVKSGYKIYGQEQVISGDHTFGDYYIDEERYKLLESCAVKAGDVLISLVGTYGKLLIMPERFEPGIINPRLMKISFDKEKVNPYYFKFFFQSESLKRALSENTHGGTMDILNLGIVRKIVMPLPPLELQNEFVSFTEQIDKSKATIQKSLEQTQLLFDSLMQEYFDEGGNL